MYFRTIEGLRRAMLCLFAREKTNAKTNANRKRKRKADEVPALVPEVPALVPEVPALVPEAPTLVPEAQKIMFSATEQALFRTVFHNYLPPELRAKITQVDPTAWDFLKVPAAETSNAAWASPVDSVEYQGYLS